MQGHHALPCLQVQTAVLAADHLGEQLRQTVVPTDRQPHTMRTFPDGADDVKVTVTVPNYKATVTAEEAPLLERSPASRCRQRYSPLTTSGNSFAKAR